MRPWLRAAVGLGFGLCAAELAVRAVLLLAPLPSSFGRASPTLGEVAWWVEQVRGTPSNARFSEDPVLGWVNPPGEHPLDGHIETVRPDGTRQTGPRGEGPRVLLLGDSFTFGTEVADADAWASVVQREHPDWAVVARGVPAYGVGQTWLARRGAGAADVVVLGLNRLMVERTMWRFGGAPRPMVAFDEAGCRAPAPFPDVDTRRAAITWRPKLLDLVHAAWELVHRPSEDEAWRRAERLLDCVVSDARAPTVVVWFPLERELRGDVDPLHRAWQGWCEHADVLCVDALPALQARAEADGTVRLGMHWTPGGHRAVASTVGPAVASVLLDLGTTP